MSKRLAVIGGMAACALTMTALTACSQNDSADRTSDRGALSSQVGDVARSTRAQTHRFLSLFSGYSADYEPFKSPDEMANASSLIVGGFIDSVVPGRTWYPGEIDESHTVVVQLRVEKVYQGTLPPDSNGTVSFEVKSGGVPAEEFNKYAPRDKRVLVYLVPAPQAGAGYGNIVVADSQSSFSEDALFHPVNPQAFMLEIDHEGVATPIDMELHEGDTIGEYLPRFADQHQGSN